MAHRLNRAKIGWAVLLLGATLLPDGAGRWPPGCLERPQARADESTALGERAAAVDPSKILGQNMACYVCHMTFVQEELARTHLHAEVGCVKCHGLSAAHANDEDIGATAPDISYDRDQVDASCRKCHNSHEASPRSVIRRFVDRQLDPNEPAVCTDCHGEHKIHKAAEVMPARGE